VAGIVEPGGGWRHALVDSATPRGSYDIGDVQNKQDTHAHPAAVLVVRACGIHGAAAATAVAETMAVWRRWRVGGF
jgi:hypothetical protein